MKVVHKFRLKPGSNYVPANCRILSVGAQHNVPVLWALVDAGISTEFTVEVVAVVTGAPCSEGMGPFIGTVLLDGGNFVLHVFGPREKP